MVCVLVQYVVEEIKKKAFKVELVAYVIPWRCCSPQTRHGQRPRAPLTVSTPNDPSLVDGREGGAGAVSASPRSPHLPLLLGKHYSTAPPSPSAAVVVSRQTWTSLVPVRMGQDTDPNGWKLLPVTPVGPYALQTNIPQEGIRKCRAIIKQRRAYALQQTNLYDCTGTV